MNYSEVVLQSAGPDESSRCSEHAGESDFLSPLLCFPARWRTLSGGHKDL